MEGLDFEADINQYSMREINEDSGASSDSRRGRPLDTQGQYTASAEGHYNLFLREHKA